MLDATPQFSNTVTSSLPLSISVDQSTGSVGHVLGTNRAAFEPTATLGARPKEVEHVSSGTLPAAIITNLMEIARSGVSEVLFGRFVRLAQSRESRIVTGKLPMSPRSLQLFLNFWQKVRQSAVEPDIFLLPNGNVQAEWARKRNLMTIEFRGDSEIFFSVADGSGEITGKERASAYAEILAMLLARRSKPFSWAP